MKNELVFLSTKNSLYLHFIKNRKHFFVKTIGGLKVRSDVVVRSLVLTDLCCILKILIQFVSKSK